MSHQINKDAIREAIGIDEDYYVAIWRADGNKDKQLNKIILSNLIENLNTKNYANYDLTFTGNRIHNVANYTITHNNSASYAYNLIAASAYSVGITTTTAAFRVSDGGMTIGSKSTVPTKVLDVVGDARIRTVSNDNALTNLLAIDANGNVFYRTSSSLTPSSAALTKTDDTNVTLTLGGSPSTALLAAASITVGWTGTLADSRIASASTWNAKIGGSGTTNYISKFTASGTIGNSLIQDNSFNIGINNSPQSLYKVYINSDKLVGLGVFNNAASGTNNFGISGSATNANTESNVGVFGNALLSSGGTNLGVRGQSASQTVTDSTSIISAGSNVGGFFQANASSATSYGLVSSADALSNQPSATFIGALLRANNAGTRYAAQLIDGTEGSGKFFKSVTSSGHGNWAAIAATDITSGLGSALQYLRVNSGGTALEYANLSLTLQNVYDASTQPQILTSVAKGGVVIRSGQALDTNSLLELKNIAGSSTFVVGGNGIVANGDWQATAIAAAFGGTGQTSYTIGDIIYASNTTAIAKLGIGTSGQVLTVSGGGVPTWAAVSSSNLGSANLTSSDDARTFTLKTGTTSSQNFQIKNSAGKVGYYFDGANSIAFRTTSFNSTYGGSFTNFNIGESANPVAMAIHLDSVSNSQYYAYRHFAASKVLMNVEARGAYQWFNQTSNSNTDIQFTLYGNGARIATNAHSTSVWQTGYSHYYNGIAQATIYTTNGLHGQIDVSNSSGTVKAVLSSSRSGSEAVWFADGLVLGGIRGRSATPFFDVMGPGSTSATTTALFQNSSSAKSLEILDSGAINIYNSGGFRIGYLNVYGGGVFGGNNNGGIGNDPNNVLGGSYQNGIILGGYTNTHNGYQGVIGGGFNTVTTNGTWNFVFSVGSTASAVAASVFGGGSHTASGAYSAVLGGDSNTASGIGAVAVGGNQASASGYRSFAQGYGSSATSDYAVVMGSYCGAVARSARAVGEYCVASGVSSWASGLGTLYGGTGKDLNASGLVSFNHSFNDGTVLYRSAEGNYSAILGGTNHWTKSGSTSSAILGGEGNTINASVLRSVILGGTGITATASDTAYAININASTLITTPQVITTPATITVAANAGTVTRANRINKFTNSSAATMTITMSTTAALDGDLVQVRIYDFSAATQTITWVNTENSSVTVPATSNGSTTLPLTVGFQYNSATSKWRCIGSV